MDLKGAVAVVTGGGTGIGRATAIALAEAGAQAVVVNYARSKDDAEQTARDLGSYGCEGVPWQADVCDESQVISMMEGVGERFGRLDVLVNNAGTTVYVPIPDLDSVTDEAWRDIIATNVMGPWYCTRAAAKQLRKARGCVVNVASLAGHRAVSSSLPYGVSKAGLIQMTRALAYALAPEVRVNSISPGQVVSRWARVRKGEEFAQKLEQGWAEMVPLKRAIAPEDCAEAIMGLLRSDSITGQDLLVDSGRSL